MAFRCPPELTLRQAARRCLSRVSNSSLVTSRPVSQTVSTYRAAMVTELGKPLEIQSMDKAPEVPEGFARVAIHHASVNFSDILVSQGRYQVKPPLPFTPGAEFAGEILELGAEEINVKVGDKVFGMSPILSAFAEQILVPTSALIPIPPQMPTDIASAITCVYGTAWMALKRHAKLQPGETVLVTSAAGGVGLAAVDLAANLFNAKVIAACGSDAKCEVAKSRGAYATINYSREKINERVKELTEGRGADVIMDSVGGDVFKACLRSIAFEGRIMVIGFASGEIPQIPANILLVKSISVIGIFWGSYRQRHPEAFQESVQGVLDAFTQKKINPYVSKVVPLDRINEAFKFILDRKSTGKVVIDCRHVQ